MLQPRRLWLQSDNESFYRFWNFWAVMIGTVRAEGPARVSRDIERRPDFVVIGTGPGMHPNIIHLVFGIC